MNKEERSLIWLSLYFSLMFIVVGAWLLLSFRARNAAPGNAKLGEGFIIASILPALFALSVLFRKKSE